MAGIGGLYDDTGREVFGFYDTTCTPSIDWSSMLGFFESHTDLPGS
jgi:hypothetical protein